MYSELEKDMYQRYEEVRRDWLGLDLSRTTRVRGLTNTYSAVLITAEGFIVHEFVL